MNTTHLYYLAGYFLLFVGAATAWMLWRVKRSGTRSPVDFKFLREPGESLRKRAYAFDGGFETTMALLALIPFATSAPGFLLLAVWKPQSWTSFGAWAGTTLVLALIGLVLAFRVAISKLERWRSDRLGYFGEREVGERLTPLLARGYRVFHDVPAKGKTSDFNLDHVTVGPAGVALIETKTRRKPRKADDGSDYKVCSDGTVLRWAQFEERESIRQTTAQADWLKDFIHQRTGLKVAVRPVIAIPGWWVNERARKAVAVVNAKSVCSAVEVKGDTALAPAEIDLIARQLEERCRDVKDL